MFCVAFYKQMLYKYFCDYHFLSISILYFYNSVAIGDYQYIPWVIKMQFKSRKSEMEFALEITFVSFPRF